MVPTTCVSRPSGTQTAPVPNSVMLTLQEQSVRRAEVDANDLSTVVYGMLRASRELPQMAEVTLDIPRCFKSQCPAKLRLTKRICPSTVRTGTFLGIARAADMRRT